MRHALYLSFILISMITIISSDCNEDSSDSSDSDSSESTSTSRYSIESIYADCNDTFITTIEYLEVLNQTGRFPEESDKTPLSGIYDEMENVNSERAVEIGWVNSEQIVENCFDEMVGSACQKAYYLVRCVTMRNLEDSS
ncbi:general odorant-binding protein 84a-like [Armigeres subalbatus]|uniref:general odorant-binding protein 84a-like n=1 Tax=Armigeres subalbatus TaxID=124917 RepID=UPI002ED51A9F